MVSGQFWNQFIVFALQNNVAASFLSQWFRKKKCLLLPQSSEEN